MTTECNAESFLFQGLGRREVVAHFDGGTITSDAGALLLRETERITGIVRRFAGCFTDHRDPNRIEHTAEELIAQRVYGLCLGYEDLNDHDQLRHDPLPAVLVGKEDPRGEDRRRDRDQGKALAGKSTLNRLELTPVRADKDSRYKKITLDRRAVQEYFVQVFLQAHDSPPPCIILDLDATDIPLHGHQAGRFFHGYYDGYCYLPLYIFCGEHLLCAKLRPSNIDGSAGALKEVQRIIAAIREHWPTTLILIRGDSGFCREAILVLSLEGMAWCEKNGVYCARGDMENRIKEQQLCLFADRTSSTVMRANELRLWFSSVAYTLMTALQRLGLQGTELAPAQCDTIRLKPLKIGARIRVTVRKVWVSLAESFPYRALFQRVYENLIRRCPLPLRC